MKDKRKSGRMTPELAAKAKALLAEGLWQHEVAARLSVNQGRISEIKNGQRFADVKPDFNAAN